MLTYNKTIRSNTGYLILFPILTLPKIRAYNLTRRRRLLNILSLNIARTKEGLDLLYYFLGELYNNSYILTNNEVRYTSLYV